MGNLGSQLADMCAALGMKVVHSNRHKRDDTEHEYVGLDELYGRADGVVLTVPLTEETRHLIDEEALEKMKDGVVLVNVGESDCSDGVEDGSQWRDCDSYE